MNLILFTGNECNVCHEVEEAFKKQFKDEIESGEADISNLDEDEGAQEFWYKHELPLAPVIAVVSDKGNLISVIDPSTLIEKKAETGGAPPAEVPSGREGK